MHHTLILYRNEEEDLSLVRWLLKSLEKTAQKEGSMGREDTVLVSFCPVNNNFEVVDSSIGGQWTALNTLDIENIRLCSDTTSEGDEPSSSQNSTLLPDYLHDLADDLPYAGFTLKVYLIHLDLKHESCMLTVGALLRLREWHGAHVLFVEGANQQQDDLMQTLSQVFNSRLLHARDLVRAYWPAWRGSVIWPGDKGFTQRGVCLDCLDLQRLKDKLQDLHFWSRKSSRRDGRAEEADTDLVLGRQMEVLACASLDSVPLYLIDDFHLHLHLNGDSRFAQLLAALNERDALMLRIPLYEKGDIPVASSHGLSTAVWKESIVASEQLSLDPERSALPCRQHLFLMIVGHEGGGLPGAPKAIVLHSPSQINTPGLFDDVHQEAYFGFSHGPETQSEADDKIDHQVHSMLDSLPLVTAADFHITDEACSRSFVRCVKEKQKNSTDKEGKVKLTTGNLLDCVREGQETFLQRGQKQTASSLGENKAETDCDFIPPSVIADLERVSAEWPERRALLENESKAKALRRYQSNESCSLMLSSPLAPEDSSMDAKDMLKWFKPDGNAVHEDLSPVKPAVRPTRMSNYEEASMEWPACKYMQFHGVYYEHSKKSEKQEQFFQKFRDNILLEESLHVCSDNPGVPALRYRNHSRRNRSSRNQMDVSCGGSKLTPITRTSLSPSSMLQATPSAKRRLTKESRRQTDVSPKAPPAGGDGARFSAPRSSVSRDRSRSLDSNRSGKERLSLESLAIRDSFEGDRSQNSSSVYYPKKADPSLPPFRRRSKPEVSIFTPSSSQKLQDRVGSEGDLSENASGLSGRKRSSASVSSEEGERRQSTESVDSSASTKTTRPRQSRSQRHKKRLERVVTAVLGQAGVNTSDTLYPSCFSKLYQVTLFYAKQLPHSHNLKAEMWTIAQKQVEQVVDLEKRRQDLAVKKKLRKTSLVG